MNLERYIPAYTPLERLRVPRPVDRIGFLLTQCRGKKVLDLGAMDETAYSMKRGKGTWLHEEIARVAVEVIGIDSSALIPDGGLRTAGNALIHRIDIEHLDEWLKSSGFEPDIIVAGELIEHLDNPLGFLKSLKSISSLTDKVLIFTTPNATAAHNALISLISRESTHHDHLAIFSFKTLTTLCNRAGFNGWAILPYRSSFSEMKLRNGGIRGSLVAAGEKAINLVEWLFPLASFGYTVMVRI